MKHLRSLLVGVVALATFPATAQNVVPQTGLTFGYLAKTTYSAAFIGLVPAAATTDMVCLAGSATKTVRLQSLKLSGSGTAISVPVTLLKRVTADTGGTAASTTANPANTISKRDSGNATATAVPIAYTANPTIVDTSPTYVDSAQLGVVATTVGLIAAPTIFDYGEDPSNLRQAPTLRGVAEQLCINLNGTSATALLTGTMTWIEE
jgi:hypothetical protein